MKKIRIGSSIIEGTQIALGCMRLSADRQKVLESIRAALDAGIDFFDHADIYGGGEREAGFAAIWEEIPSLREKVVIQSKCGIRFAGHPHGDSPQRYDFSYEHIVRSVEGSLQRLKTDYLDLLLLHRPDPLVEPEEVARAFAQLQRDGKVLHFGVSNHTAAQIELLKTAVEQPIIANQLELSVVHTHLIDEGIAMNRGDYAAPTRNEGTLEYCRLNGITIQAWSPLAGGAICGRPLESPDERIETTAELIGRMASEKGVSSEAIAVAWVLRHPAKIQAIIGTTNPARIAAACQADDVELTREEWYRLFLAGRGQGLP